MVNYVQVPLAPIFINSTIMSMMKYLVKILLVGRSSLAVGTLKRSLHFGKPNFCAAEISVLASPLYVIGYQRPDMDTLTTQ